ncbi:hypothetical protein BST61_g6010 [Cercospora zeina]
MQLKRLLVALPTLVSAQVHPLTTDTFAQFIKHHDTVLLVRHDHNIVFAKVDCTDMFPEEHDLCHDISAYPTLRLYHGSTQSFQPYEGRRKSSDDIISAMTNGTYPTSPIPVITHEEKYQEPPSRRTASIFFLTANF